MPEEFPGENDGEKKKKPCSAQSEPPGSQPAVEEIEESEDFGLELSGDMQLTALIENNLKRSESLGLCFDTLAFIESEESYQVARFKTFEAFFLKQIGNSRQLSIYKAWATGQIGLEEAGKKWQIGLFEEG